MQREKLTQARGCIEVLLEFKREIYHKRTAYQVGNRLISKQDLSMGRASAAKTKHKLT